VKGISILVRWIEPRAKLATVWLIWLEWGSVAAHHGRWWGVGRWLGMHGGAAMAAEAWCTLADGDEELVVRVDVVVISEGGPGPHSIWAVASATPATWCNALCRLFLHYRSGESDVWGLLFLRILEAVLGFFSRQDEDQSDACLHRSGGSVMFWKAPSVGASCLEIADSNGIFFLRVEENTSDLRSYR
jgi:hypothetical protein